MVWDNIVLRSNLEWDIVPSVLHAAAVHTFVQLAVIPSSVQTRLGKINKVFFEIEMKLLPIIPSLRI